MRPFAARIRRLLVVGALTLGGATAVMVAFERRFIYFPTRDLEVTPRELGMSFEELALTAEDGVRLHGWFLPARGARRTVLLSHGNAGNISHRLDRALLIQARLGADVLLYDYRGYGQSQGRPDEEGTYRDARAAYRYLAEERRVEPRRLVLFGESLGSAVSLQLALERPCRALVLESAFASVPAMARAVYPFLPLAPFVRTRYDNLAKAPKLGVPLLMVHGERDSIVPLSQGRRVFEAAPAPKRFFLIPRADHNDTYVTGGPAYWDVVSEFLEGLEAEGKSASTKGSDAIESLERTVVRVGRAEVTLTRDDAEAIREALLGYLTQSTYEDRDELLRWTRGPAWIDHEGYLRIGPWLLGSEGEDLILRYREPPAGLAAKAHKATVARKDGTWTVTRLVMERIKIRR